MLDFLTNVSESVIDVLVPTAIIITPVIVYSFFFDIFDNLFNVLDGYSLISNDIYSDFFEHKDSVLYIKNNYKDYFNMKFTQFVISFEVNDRNNILFNNLKTIIFEHKKNNYDFFIGHMRGNIKNRYINLLNSINENTDLSTFLDKSLSIEFIHIFILKVYKM